MDIDFKYINIVNHNDFVSGSRAVVVPTNFTHYETFLGADYDRATAKPWQYYEFTVDKQDGANRIYGYSVYNASRLYTHPRTAVAINMSVADIVNAVNAYKRVITVEPSEEAKKAITAILKVVDKKKNIFISQIFLYENRYFSKFKGVSIFCNNLRVGTIDDEGNFIVVDLASGTDYDRFFAVLKNEPEVLTVDNYANVVQQVCAFAGITGERIINDEHRNHSNEVGHAKDRLVSLSQDYAKAVKANRVAKKFTEQCPPELKYFLDRGLKDAKKVVLEVENLKESYEYSREKVTQAKLNVDHMKACVRQAGSDWGQVQKLLKKGIIESIEFHPKKGLRIVYSPLTYDYSVRNGANPPGIAFLGRVEVCVGHRSGLQRIAIKAISYPHGNYGTHHWGLADGRHCLGTYANVFDMLIAKRQIAQFILVMREYLTSKNENSILYYPDWSQMDINNPKVLDDSFEVWKKNLIKKAKAEAKEDERIPS